MNADTHTFLREVTVDRQIDMADAIQVSQGTAVLTISPAARQRCAAAHHRLQETISGRNHVYGLTTGFGPLANRLVGAGDGKMLQQNLVHHLATGVGPCFCWQVARAIVLCRLMSILQGVSGASDAAIDALLVILRSGLAPAIPQRGTVGASGDLTPLAHFVLCLQGRGDFLAADGTVVPGRAALHQLDLRPLGLEARDGLALVNGTSAMTGVALTNAGVARQVIDWGLALSAGMAEVMCALVECWDPIFSEIRPHPGQRAATLALQDCIAGSTLVRRTPISTRRLDVDDVSPRAEIGQAAYTIRCVPQVLGAVIDAAEWHDRVVQTELCAATDNPVFPEGREAPAYHGGNFMGQHVALASVALGTAATVAANLAERQIARLTDELLNGGLPAFLHRGMAGLNSGFMGAQVTATALLAEMRSVGPASVHSLSTNGANQDVVSMGTIAARQTAERLARTVEIQAILALCVAQAADLRRESDPAMRASSRLQELCEFVRVVSPPLNEDRPLGRDIEELAQAMSRMPPPGSG